MNSSDIEIAAARHFNYRLNIIVPNVSWGMGLQYEADLVVLRPSDYAIEIEIKTSKADVERDLHKRHRHDSRLFRELWFAVPEYLSRDSNIPDAAGILAIEDLEHGFKPVKIRPPKPNKAALRWTSNQKNKLLHLGMMRIWGLKENLSAQKQRRKKNV